MTPEQDDARMTRLLQANGVSKFHSMILMCFSEDDDELSSYDIELRLRMRQPEVSVATKEMRDMGWLSVRQEKRPGIGRPVNMYSLSRPLNEIIREIVRKRMDELDEQQALAHDLLGAVA